VRRRLPFDSEGKYYSSIVCNHEDGTVTINPERRIAKYKRIVLPRCPLRYRFIKNRDGCTQVFGRGMCRACFAEYKTRLRLSPKDADQLYCDYLECKPSKPRKISKEELINKFAWYLEKQLRLSKDGKLPLEEGCSKSKCTDSEGYQYYMHEDGRKLRDRPDRLKHIELELLDMIYDRDAKAKIIWGFEDVRRLRPREKRIEHFITQCISPVLFAGVDRTGVPGAEQALKNIMNGNPALRKTKLKTVGTLH